MRILNCQWSIFISQLYDWINNNNHFCVKKWYNFYIMSCKIESRIKNKFFFGKIKTNKGIVLRFIQWFHCITIWLVWVVISSILVLFGKVYTWANVKTFFIIFTFWFKCTWTLWISPCATIHLGAKFFLKSRITIKYGS